MLMTTNNIPDWKVSGDWFDVCKCSIPCPLSLLRHQYMVTAMLYWRTMLEVHYGQISLDDLNVLVLSYFKGNIWAGLKTIGLFFDEKANLQQREALQMIFSGKAGGFMAEFAKLIQDVRGIEYVPIKFEVSDDLSNWSAEVPGKVVAKAEALSGPMTPPGKRVQTINPPGSERRPGTIATWGKAITNEVDAMGFKWEWDGRSSKHIPFDWSGP